MLVIVSVVAIACGAGADETIERTFEVGASPRLLVGADNGDVVVQTGPDFKITVLSDITSPDNVDLDVTADGDVVTVRSSTTFSGNLLGDKAEGRVDLTITVPLATVIEVGINTGAVTIADIQAGGHITAAAGSVTLRRVSGDFSGGTGTGDVTISAGTGSFQFTTGVGAITFEGELVVGGFNEFETGVGDVTVTIPEDAGVRLDTTVSSGSVSNDLAIADESSAPSLLGGRLSGTIGDGGAGLTIVVGIGSVRIRAATDVGRP